MMEERTYKKVKYLLTAGVVVFGTLSTLLSTLGPSNDFSYPLFQTFMMFIGEMLNIIIFLPKLLCRKRSTSVGSSYNNEPLKKNFSERVGKSIYILSMVLDFTSTIIENYCMIKLHPSDFVCMKMTVTIYVLLYRILIQKRKPYKHQWIGMFIYISGIALSIIGNYLASSDEVNQNISYMSLMLLAELFQSLNIILIEYFIWKQNADPAEINIIKGVSGMALCGICYYPIYEVTKKYTNNSSFIAPTEHLLKYHLMLFYMVLLVIDWSFFNYCMNRMLKITESLAFCTVNSARVVIVSLIVILALGQIREFYYLQIIGSCFISLGLIIYNELLILPFFGFDKSARLSIEENKNIRKLREKHNRWITSLDRLLFEMENKLSK
ncbi:hypothetical protein SteCoe_7078 [Stentor coeruleus]|uniref:EamA domain-containing protein n=1 Tax=Stentor coeruleus TaxID=5963 RepID=A0A1R2CND1_9CILI|nr:hypothetical protein SteCoe_7078 [Stentor coeruleus]